MSDSFYNSAIDYCTDFFDGINLGFVQWDWRVCCYQHDLDYSNLVNKATADWNLAACVTHHTGPMGIGIASLMWLGVTSFGLIFYYHAWREKNSK